MKHKRNIQIINELTSIAENVQNPFDFHNIPHRFFDIGKSNISFVGYDNIILYQNGLESLYNFDKEISETLSLGKFEYELITLIKNLKNQNRECTLDDIENLFNSFNNIEIQEYEILYELFGATMVSKEKHFGDFIIYNYKLFNQHLINKYPKLIDQDLYFHDRRPNYLIGIKVKARDNNKAVETAKTLCESFENVFSYMIADLKHEYSVGIFNYRIWYSINTVICSKKSMGLHQKKQFELPVNIENEGFNDKPYGNYNIWYLITKPNKTEIEKRLLNSIEWIGKAIHEIDFSKSLVQFVFAIECMLHYNENS